MIAPTVGRIVHYYAQDPVDVSHALGPYAAIVTAVALGDVYLTVFPPPMRRYLRDEVGASDVRYSESEPPTPHTWRWPSRA